MVDSKRNLMMCFSGTDESTRIDGNLQGQTASTGGSRSSMLPAHFEPPHPTPPPTPEVVVVFWGGEGGKRCQ